MGNPYSDFSHQIGRGKRSLSRVIEWLRKAQEKIALLTNGRRGLFAPGNKEATDPILRALSRFENNSDSPSDAVVHQILKLLTRSKVKVRQGKQNTWVEAPVDFSDLSSEYIGILYEGLLDFELRQADEDDPIIFLDLGDQPALPLKRLEAMDEKALASLVEKLKDKAKPETSEDVEEDKEEEDTAPLSNDDVEIAPLSKAGLFHSIKIGNSESLLPSHLRASVIDKKPNSLKRFIPIVLKTEKLTAVSKWCTGDESSLNITSFTQCIWFSIPQG